MTVQQVIELLKDCGWAPPPLYYFSLNERNREWSTPFSKWFYDVADKHQFIWLVDRIVSQYGKNVSKEKRRDLNKVFAELYEKIDSLGANEVKTLFDVKVLLEYLEEIAKHVRVAKRISKIYPTPMYALKSVSCNGEAYNGFIWPTSGTVSAPNWEPTRKCGNGLHAFLDGQGDGSIASWYEKDRWLVLEIPVNTEIINLGGHVKFPTCDVIHCGDHASATRFLFDKLLSIRVKYAKIKDIGNPKNIIGLVYDTNDSNVRIFGGYNSYIHVGKNSDVVVHDKSVVIAGENSSVRWDYREFGHKNRVVWKTYHQKVGENGIKPNVPYKGSFNWKTFEFEVIEVIEVVPNHQTV